MVLLTDICLACRQALLRHGHTVYLFATENSFYHSDDILQQISYLLYVSEKVESAFEKISGLLPTNYESLRIKVISNTLNHNFNFMVFFKTLIQKYR